MAVFSSLRRCNQCGSRLPRNEMERGLLRFCPNCSADLAHAGVWCDLTEWAITRKMGRTRFIWREWVWIKGGLRGLVAGIGLYVAGASWFLYLLTGAVILAFMYIGGAHYWTVAEREFQKKEAEEFKIPLPAEDNALLLNDIRGEVGEERAV